MNINNSKSKLRNDIYNLVSFDEYDESFDIGHSAESETEYNAGHSIEQGIGIDHASVHDRQYDTMGDGVLLGTKPETEQFDIQLDTLSSVGVVEEHDSSLNSELFDTSQIEKDLGYNVIPETQKIVTTPTTEQSGRKKTDSRAMTSQMRLTIYDWLQCIVTAILLGVMLFIFVGRTIGVDGISMLNTLRHNDRVIVSNLFYTPANGDIIIFESPSERFENPLVKRVIAIEGQWVDLDFDTGEVIVDDVVIDEPFIDVVMTVRHDFAGPVYVPEGYVFVLGDNRNNTVDSRCNSIGLVDTRYILGKVLFILMPGPDSDGQRDWSRVGTVS